MLVALVSLAALSACGAEEFVPPDLGSPIGDPRAESRAVTLDDLIELRDIGGISVSPDGRQVAFQIQQADARNNVYRTGWYVIDGLAQVAQRQAPRFVGPGGEPELVTIERSQRRTGMWRVLAPRWSPDGKRIAYLRRERGATDVYVSAADGSTCERITSADGDVDDVAWSEDGQWLLYREGPSRRVIADAEHAEASAGFLLDNRFDLFHSFKPVRHGVPPNPSLLAISLASKQVRPATQMEAEFFAGSRHISYRSVQGTGRTVTFQGRPATRLPPDLQSRNARFVVQLADQGFVWLEPADAAAAGLSPPLRLWTSSDRVRARSCPSAHCAGYLVEMMPTPDGTGIWFIKREGWALGQRGVYFWNLRTNSVRRLLLTDALVMDCTVVPGRAICLHEGPLQPRRIVEIDDASGRLQLLFDPNPQWEALRTRPATKLEWRSDDGREIFGYLVAAQSRPGDKSPLVIAQYRAAGFLRGGVGDEYPMQSFAANGLSVLVVERPDPFEVLAVETNATAAEHQEWKDLAERRRSLAAVDSGIDSAIARHSIDPARIGITGLSDGGETVNFALIHSRHRIVAAAMSGGSRDPSWYPYLADDARARERQDGLGPIGSGDDWQWRRLGVAFNLDRIRAPLLMQVADRELLFDLTVERALKEAGHPAELYVFPDEYHVKWQPAHRRAIYARNIDWMNFWLRGIEDPAPVKAEQYKRWRAMRVKQCELFKGDDAPWYCRQ